MNRTQLIVRIIERLYDKSDHADLKQILEEELPDFQRIDWERLRDCFEKASNGYVSSHLSVAVNQYNSTLPPALVPLPKEMPALWHDAFTDLLHNRMQPSEFYSLIRKTYGTHEPKPNLPSVEELARELNRVYWGSDKGMTSLAQHLHDKYSLPTREWWQELNRGDQFIYKCGDGTPKRVGEGLGIQADDGKIYHVDNCYPYTTPSAQDIIAKHNLSEEEIRAIREGKCT